MARDSRRKDKAADKKGRGRGRDGKAGGRPRRGSFFMRRKGCFMCAKRREANYKDLEFLGEMMTERGTLLTRRITGICATHQRQVAVSVKRARILAMLPFERN